MTSIEGDEVMAAGSDRARAAVSVGFVVLLSLSLFWPGPVLWLNSVTFQAPLTIDERSFLGRESPAADVLFWAIAGLYLFVVLQGRIDMLLEERRLLGADVRHIGARLRERVRRTSPALASAALGSSLAVIAAIWLFADSPLIAIAEASRSEFTRSLTRIFNRLGGGMNPALIVIFFIVAGLVFAIRRWWLLGLSMAAAALSGGIFVQLVKALVGRSRPELWLGAFHFSDPRASSFPSGHTIGAFAIASAALFGSRSLPLRVIALLLACGVGVSRVMAFRHWPSDVAASALLGIWLGWFFSTAIVQDSEHEG